MSDKELEQKLRWIFETYGKDLQAFFRDAYAEGLNVRPALPKFTQYCTRCGQGHNKAVAYCLDQDCGGKMGERRHALRAALKLQRMVFKGVPIEFEPQSGLTNDPVEMTWDFNTPNKIKS